jgi:hypothetical protein
MPPPKRPGKRAELAAWIERRPGLPVGEAEFDELRRNLAPVSENYLRKLLRESGAPLSPVVEGVRQSTFDELERSLAALTAEYERRDAQHRQAVRQLVITAKDHARWSARRDEKRAEKEEMALWMLTWLENPPLFADWVRLRKKTSGAGSEASEF